MSDHMIRLAAPGLPPFPKLYFDPVHQKAIVSARHPTWQSYQRSRITTDAMAWITTLVLARFCWHRFPPFDPVLRIVLFLSAVLVSYSIVRYIFHQTVLHFLARQIFATKTVFWFTQDAIAFCSRLYEKPVVIWRKWRKLPVRVKFLIQPDIDAVNKANHFRGMQRKPPPRQLEESQILTMVLTTFDKQLNTNLNGQDSILRSIPITEVNGLLATKFTMVYAAAVSLTTPRQHQNAGGVGGADIDA